MAHVEPSDGKDHECGHDCDPDFDEEHDPIFDDYEMEIECPYCDDGWQHGPDGISIECPECGGTGWE